MSEKPGKMFYQGRTVWVLTSQNWEGVKRVGFRARITETKEGEGVWYFPDEDKDGYQTLEKLLVTMAQSGLLQDWGKTREYK